MGRIISPQGISYTSKEDAEMTLALYISRKFQNASELFVQETFDTERKAAKAKPLPLSFLEYLKEAWPENGGDLFKLDLMLGIHPYKRCSQSYVDKKSQ